LKPQRETEDRTLGNMECLQIIKSASEGQVSNGIPRTWIQSRLRRREKAAVFEYLADRTALHLVGVADTVGP